MVDMSFLEERIAAAKARILLWEEAAAGLATNKVQSFTLDTGQTRQVVMLANITELRNAISAEYTLLYALDSRLHGGSVTARPGY